jgi:hypothetical protein
VTLPAREPAEIEAFATDHYIDALLAGRAPDDPRDGSKSIELHGASAGNAAATVNEAVRAVSRRLAADLPRFHPSFRFEEHLALRLAEAAAAMRPIRLPSDTTAEARIPVLPLAPEALAPRVTADGVPDPSERNERRPTPLVADALDVADGRAFLLGGAVAASALSLAGAAWIAWRRRGSASLMTRAVRAAHRGRLSEQVRHVTGLHG